MSDIINLLPESLANQIAAGEVIQRPASVVKELLENAVDAHATNIKLIVKDAGKSLIQVVDNGHGMTEMDARMCFERHATSKIEKTADLFAIDTKGFRGEALASIAAIASVELKTRHISQDVGSLLIVESSKIKKQESCQQSTGSSFAVKRLFFNVPARRKFLKSDAVELRHILDEFQRVAMAHHEISFSCHHNDQEIYRLPKCNLRQRVVQLLGKASNEKIIPVEVESEYVNIKGFIAKPDYSKKTRSDQFLFVNNRFFKSGYFNHAIKAAYDNIIAEGRYPSYVLFLEVNPEHMDVNVHPTKHEIKFEEEKLIYQYIRVCIRQALGKYSITPTIDFDNENKFAKQVSSFESMSNSDHNPPKNQVSGGAFQGMKAPRKEIDAWGQMYQEISDATPGDNQAVQQAITIPSAMDRNDDLKAEKTPNEGIFQLHAKYIACQIKSGLLLLDQQASHERILYERFLEMLKQEQKLVQQLLFPETIQLEPMQAEVFTQIYPELNKLGFVIEPFGNNSFIIRGTPAINNTAINTNELIQQFIASYTASLDFEHNFEQNIAKSLARSCSIKRGTILQKEELQQLIDELFACEAPYQSPFGTSCFVTMDIDFLDAQFEKKSS